MQDDKGYCFKISDREGDAVEPGDVDDAGGHSNYDSYMTDKR